ncbi:HipA domain-containing protein, partial [Trinickia sp.]|uniref:HipA domain-containing protein n=1 Tax=Trinickia sp. TaxID=2571163 RepID=UPI003F7EB554
WVVFNLIVGNMDSHAKNLSMLYDPTDDNRTRLAPFYDLLSTSIYPQLSARFAFKIGGENRPEWIMARHWERFAKETGLSMRYVRDVVSSVTKAVQAALPSVHEQMLADIASESIAKVLRMIRDNVEAQCRMLLTRIGSSSSSTKAAQ